MRAWFVAALAAVCLAGCAPVAHVELEDGTFVSLVPPKEAFDGTLAPEAVPPCARFPDIGLWGRVHTVSGEGGETLALTLRNDTDRPMALRRVFTYGGAGRSPKGDDVACDPAGGFTVTDVDDAKGRRVFTFRAEGAEHRLWPLGGDWRVRGDTVWRPAVMGGEAWVELACPIPEALLPLIRENGVVCRPLGGGRVVAVGEVGRDKEGRPEVRFRGLPPSFPVEVILGLRPGAKVPREALRAEAEPQGEEPFLLEFSVPAKRTLAPGESCVLTLRHNGFDGFPR